MKTSTLKKRIEKLTDSKKFGTLAISKSSKVYQILKDIAEGTNKSYCLPYGWDGNLKNVKIRPCYASGKGKYTSNQDHSLWLEGSLRRLGLKIETGNDAPRGGATGKYIIIKTKIERD